ncbi:TetR/AcrR family transcriptional regulator [Streptomyces sp. NPDC090023]|uniref:TetR/AcrR family transcriptional regulator n=1 Tax=unclassified Streptomyces TaxID=2593676 RepID=UPI003805E839
MSLAADRPAQPTPARGRPRSETVERAILEGVMKLLEDGVPLADLSIERVARTAGVGKATIHRRWSGKEEVFVDVMRAAEPPDPELPGTSMRDDLVAMLETLRRRGLASRSSAIMHNVYVQAKYSPRIWAAYEASVIAPRRRPPRGARGGDRRHSARRPTARQAVGSTARMCVFRHRTRPWQGFSELSAPPRTSSSSERPSRDGGTKPDIP